jgi:hypothetical protein
MSEAIKVDWIQNAGFADIQRVAEDKDGRGYFFTAKVVGPEGVLGPRSVCWLPKPATAS